MFYLETERLILRNLESKDVDTIFSYRNDKVYTKYQRWIEVSLEEIHQYVKRHKGDLFLSEKREQHYAIVLKSGKFIGEIAYYFSRKENCITLGITIDSPYQKKGYAFEILTTVLYRIKERYPSMDIVALIHRDNYNSIKLFEKLDFKKEGFSEKWNSHIYTIKGKGE